MRTKEELYQHLLPELHELEEQRLAAFARGQKALLISLAVCVGLGALILLVVYFQQGSVFWWLLLAGLVLGLIIGLSIRHQKLQKFKVFFKDRVIAAIVTNISPGLFYDAQLEISRPEFRESGLFSTYPDRYSGEDLIQGRYVKTDFRLSEIHAEERRQRKTKNGTQTYYVTIFKGLFLIADFHKHFRGRTFVLPDNSERIFGDWLSKKLQYFSGGRGDLVYLEDPEFERHFKVYSDDQVEARYILSTSMMWDILELRRRFATGIRLSFIDSKIYLAIPSSRNFLEPDIKKDLTAPETVYLLYAEVELLLKLIDDLNLNTRIWSKQEF
jgi:hypothetical protein